MCFDADDKRDDIVWFCEKGRCTTSFREGNLSTDLHRGDQPARPVVEPADSPKRIGLHPIWMHRATAGCPRRGEEKPDQTVGSGGIPSKQGRFPEGRRLHSRCCEAAGGALFPGGRTRSKKSNSTYNLTKELILRFFFLYKGATASSFISSAGMIPPACRYLPTCSDYMREALRKHGFVRGMSFSLRRLMRCQPLAAGGWDPVP